MTDYRVTITPATGRPVVTIQTKQVVSVVLGIPGPPGPKGETGPAGGGVAVSPAERAAAGEVIQILGSGPVGIWDAETQTRIATLVAAGWPLANIVINYIDSDGQAQTVTADALAASAALFPAELIGESPALEMSTVSSLPPAGIDGAASAGALAGAVTLSADPVVGTVETSALTSLPTLPDALLHLPNTIDAEPLASETVLPSGDVTGDLPTTPLASGSTLPTAAVTDAASLDIAADPLAAGSDLPPASIAGALSAEQLIADSALPPATLDSNVLTIPLDAAGSLPGSALTADATVPALSSAAAMPATSASGTVSAGSLVTTSGLPAATVEAGATAPGQVTGLAAETGPPGQVTLNWDAAATADSYDVYWRQGAAPTTALYDGVINGVTEAQRVAGYSISGPLAEGQTYNFCVRAVNGGGVGALSDAAAAAAAAVIYNFETDEEGWTLAIDDPGYLGVAPVAAWSNARGYGGSPGSIHLKGGAKWDDELQEYYYDEDLQQPNGYMSITAWASGTFKAKVWVVDGIIYVSNGTASDFVNTAGSWLDLEMPVTVGDSIVIQSFAATDSEGHIGYIRIEQP